MELDATVSVVVPPRNRQTHLGFVSQDLEHRFSSAVVLMETYARISKRRNAKSLPPGPDRKHVQPKRGEKRNDCELALRE